MATQKQTASKQTRKRPTAAKQWKGKQGVDLELPSGNVALVRNPGIQHFLRTGVIPDPLTGMVRKMISGKVDKFDPSELIQDEEQLNATFEMFDKVLVEVVVQPNVEMPPEPGAERDEEVLYADEVDFQDKVFVFQFAVGGTKDLEEYLQRSKQTMDALQAGEGVDLSPE